jgi:UDP-N-acetylglucosamine acyltransferase
MTVHPTALVAPGAELADDVEIGPWCQIGPSVKLGSGVRLRSHVVVYGDTELGESCDVYPFACLGGPPQHSAHKEGDPSRLVIGARNQIREHVTMHGGSVVGRGVTTIGDDGEFYVGSHVGHDCKVGDHVVMTNGTALGGHAVIGEHVILQQRCRVGRHAFVGGMAGVNFDVVPFAMVWGNHARLQGLNLVGLRRRGFSRAAIGALQAAFRRLFDCGDGRPFRERMELVALDQAASPEVMEVIAFIRAEPNRHLVLPQEAQAGE